MSPNLKSRQNAKQTMGKLAISTTQLGQRNSPLDNKSLPHPTFCFLPPEMELLLTFPLISSTYGFKSSAFMLS